uniref:Uncharacterized protein n=1 Tax=Tanacetum cinerariifolium TaxID=118510 RepID=A0A699SWU7_TANCI|nr:hypothetical protein [Tanacetum cinerariifolium]
MPMNSISSRDGRLPCHKVIYDDFSESEVIHFIASLLTFVLHLIHKVFPYEIGKVNVDSVIESPKHLSLRQSETVNSRAFACKSAKGWFGILGLICNISLKASKSRTLFL